MSTSTSRWTALASVVLLLIGTIVAITQGSNPVLPATFLLNGPAGFSALAKDGSVVPNGPRAGAINSFVIDPANANVIWIGAVNGGVWKTTNATTNDPAGPTWTPLTDHQPSLSIESLALDPTSPTADVLVAGIGHASSFSGKGGPLGGILRTTDGGAAWTQLGADQLSTQEITVIAARGAVIVAGSKTGIWRSTNTGGHFDRLDAAAGLLIGPVTDLAEDPSDSHRVYVGITGEGGGVFRSENDGESWTPVSGGDFGVTADDLVKPARKLMLAVHANTIAHTNAVYAALIGDDKNPSGLFRSADRGASWTQLDTPTMIEVAAQGRLSMAADPNSANVVYLGGDETPGGKGEGPVYRCDSSLPPGSQCTSIVGDGATLNNTAPHPDSRRLKFDPLGNLLAVDDGGIFKRTRPAFPLSPLGDWTSLNGNLSIAEPHSCGYDHIAQVVLCGTQDNGTVQQASTGARVWKTIARFDGGIVAVTDETSPSSRYYSSQGLGGFSRAQCDGSNVCSVTQPALTIVGTGLPLNDTNDPGVVAYTPIAAHQTDPNRLVIATGIVYESMDGGVHLTPLSGFTGTATRAIAYGPLGHPDILYVGSTDGLFLRTTGAGPMVPLAAYTFGEPVDIALDPDDWRSAWVITGSKVLHTPDAGSNWSDVTFDLGPGGAGADNFNTVALIPALTAPIIAVGASDGLYVTDTSQIGHWYKLEGALPNAVVQDLEYDATDDILLVTTLGRSTWMIRNAKSSIHLPAPTTLTYTGDTSVDYHDVAHLSATLAEVSHGQPVAGKAVVFTIGSQSCSGVTGASGSAACDVVITQLPGGFTATASFGGDVSFAPSTTSAAFAITREETTLHYTGDTLIADGFTAHLAAMLREDDVTPIVDSKVSFTLGSGTGVQSCEGSTDATGTARCNISPVSQPLGSGIVRATFPGNLRYLPSSDQVSTLIFAFLSSGSFVVGDGGAVPGGAVTFWGARWSKLNPMTGGSAPSSFKGFGGSLSASPPACGGTWTSSPGNSSNPPASVPSYMGVIASGQVGQNGPLLSGDVPAIVIVKTDAGYAPNPGHAGTGQVLAVFCHQ